MQVEGCNANLSLEKVYCQKKAVCSEHLKVCGCEIASLPASSSSAVQRLHPVKHDSPSDVSNASCTAPPAPCSLKKTMQKVEQRPHSPAHCCVRTRLRTYHVGWRLIAASHAREQHTTRAHSRPCKHDANQPPNNQKMTPRCLRTGCRAG